MTDPNAGHHGGDNDDRVATCPPDGTRGTALRSRASRGTA